MAQLNSRLWIDYYIGGILYFIFKPAVILLGLILRRNHDLSQVREVTFLKFLGGGSLAVAYPTFLALKRSPQIKRLRIVVTSQTAPFARALGVFDEIIVIRDGNLFSLVWDSFTTIMGLLRAEAVVDLEIHSRLSTVFALLTMAKNRLGGYTHNSFWRGGLSTHLVFYNTSTGVYLFYDQFAQLFSAPIPPFSECVDVFGKHAMGAFESTAAVDGSDIAIAPCCSDLGRERMMRWEQWQEAFARNPHSGTPVRVHLLGGSRDKPMLEEFKATLASIFPNSEIINQAGKLSLTASIGLLGKIKTLYCIDSALLHFARLQGVNTVSFWGPTDPATRLRPTTVSLDQLHYGRIACSPCVHVANVAPCKGRNICMAFAVNPECGLNANPIWLAEGEPFMKDLLEKQSPKT